MAQSSPLGAAAPASQPDDLGLHILYKPGFWFEYNGTRAQLEAEGVIPAGAEWPQGDGALVTWESGQQYFALQHRCPPGKGGRKRWRDADFWCLFVRIDAVYGPKAGFRAARMEYEARKRDVAWADTLVSGMSAARRDTAFQAFKAKYLPSYFKKQPGRPHKSAAMTAGVSPITGTP
jgi:hypothetical protein